MKVWIFRNAMGLFSKWKWRKALPTALRTIDRDIPVADSSIKARVYTPEQGRGPFPVIVFYHGGGFILGDIESHEGLCRDLCVQSNHIVVSVNYRRAPESPFPAAAHDAIAALAWTLQNIDNLNGDVKKIYVAGDSAGGNLAAVVALQAREKFPAALCGQILIYPVTDHYSKNSPSYVENGSGNMLTKDTMVWFWDTYLANSPLLGAGEVQHELATPLAANDLSNLPAALVLTAGKDPLRDEGRAYGERLAAQGCAIQSTDFPDYEHGFLGLSGPGPEHVAGMTEIVAWLAKQRSL